MSGSNAISGIAIVGAIISTTLDGEIEHGWDCCCYFCNDQLRRWFYGH